MERWENFAEFDQTHYVDTEYARQGSGSLRIPSVHKTTEATIYRPSLNTETNTAASEGRVKTMIRRTKGIYIGMYLRFVDLENHYFIAGGNFQDYRNNSSLEKLELRLFKTEDGKSEVVNAVDFETFSDRTNVASNDPSWVPFRITWFSDGLDGFRIWVQEDANEDGEWDDVGGTLVDPDPSFSPSTASTGGGIGFGGNVAAGETRYDLESEFGLWYDQTNIYYDTNA